MQLLWQRGLGLIVGIALLPVSKAYSQPSGVESSAGLLTTGEQTTQLNTETSIGSEELLTIGIGGTPPFLIRSNGSFQGLVPDLWEEIARINSFEYELVLQTNTQEALDAVAAGELDLLIGPFTITSERLEQVNFTHSFFTSGEGLLLQQRSPTVWSRVRPFFTTAALSSVGGLLVCLFLVGNSMWLAERKRNPDHFSDDYISGIGQGMWFALVTLTTVGYGDCTPVTFAGRIIASTWMLISLIAVSSLVAGLASALTLALSETPGAPITSPIDLQQARIAAVTDSAGATTAMQYGARLLQRAKLEEAINLVVQGRADAVIFDRPSLEYYLLQNPELDLRLAAFTLNSVNFGFALPYDSTLTKLLNVTIMQLKEDGIIEATNDRWLHDSSTESKISPSTTLFLSKFCCQL